MHISTLIYEYMKLLNKNYEQFVRDVTKEKENDYITLRELDITNEILKHLNENRFYSIMIIGLQGSGKTNTAKYIISKVYNEENTLIKYYKGREIIERDIEQDVKTSDNYDNVDNVILVLDDLSYLLSTLSNKEASEFKNFIGLIRHRFNKRVLLIMISHITSGLPPLLRNSNYIVYQSLSLEDLHYLSKTIQKKDIQDYIQLLNNLNKHKSIYYNNMKVVIGKDERAVLTYDFNAYKIYKVPKTNFEL